MSDDESGQIDMFGHTKPEQPEKGKKQQAKPLSKVARRAIKASLDIQMEPPEVITYQHTVLCQTSMPYRNPGKDVIRWERKQWRLEGLCGLNMKVYTFFFL